MKKIVLCITGMHRTGTSLAASWLESCGLTIHDGEFWGPSVGNPKGHFEDKDFVKLHSDAILLKSPKSKGWKIFSDTFLTFNREHTSRAYEMINARNTKYSSWGWKDPRTCLFLPLWKTIIPELKVFLIWRPCLAVAHSLERRSRNANQKNLKIGALESVKLWMCYNEQILAYKKQYPTDTVLFPLNYIIRNNRAAFDLIEKRLQVKLRNQPISNIYDPGLLHSEPKSLFFKLVCRYYNTSKIEDELLKYSDV